MNRKEKEKRKLKIQPELYKNIKKRSNLNINLIISYFT